MLKTFGVGCDKMSKKRNKYAGDQPSEYAPTGVWEYIGLGRSINFANNVTRFVLMSAVVISVVVTLFEVMNGVGSGNAVTDSVGIALGFIFAYIIGQELDPDRRVGGVVGGIFTLGAYYIYGRGNLLVLLWLLFALRMLNRSSGDRHRIVDNIIIIGSAAWLGREGFWVYPLLTGGAYILESQIQGGYFRSLYLAGISLACLFFAEYNSQPNMLSLYYICLVSIAFILYLPAIRVSEYVQVKGDRSNKRLLPKRLQAMMAFFLMVLFGVTFLHGDVAANALIPAYMAAIGVGINLLIALVRHQVVFRK